MSQEALLHYKKLGISEESDFANGTITAATKLLAMRENGIVVGLAPNIISPKRISGRASKKSAILGTLSPKFTIPTYAFPTGLSVKLLKMALGQDTATEVASFTVQTGVNDKIDMTEDGGGAFAITLTAGTYKAGATSADAGTLCALLKTLIEAGNGAATYTVTYSTTTKKFTITKNSGVFVIKWATGTNTATSARSLLGFTNADTSSAISATSDSTVESVWDHVIKPLDAITYGLSAGMTAQIGLASGKVYDVLDAVIETLKIGFKPNQELYLDAECEARKVADSAASLSALTEESTSPFLYSQLAYTVGGAAHNLSALEISYANNFKKDLHINSQYRSRFPRGGFRDVKGTFTLDLADSKAYSIYDAFIAGTQPELIATFSGASNGIKTGFAYAMTIDLAKVQYNLEAVPGGGGESAPDAPIPFEALDDGTNGEMKITVRNNEATS
jgi:hypothetical protein